VSSGIGYDPAAVENAITTMDAVDREEKRELET
jgi:hypothetical protein